MMKMGWTSATGPVASAVAWQTAAQDDHPDAGQPYLAPDQVAEQGQVQRARGGAVAAAIRCKTDARPLNNAVSSANKTDTTAAS